MTNHNSTEQLVLNADEAQLDLALSQRGKIYKGRTKKVESKSVLEKKDKDLTRYGDRAVSVEPQS